MTKSVKYFYKNAAAPDGLDSRCKECTSKLDKERKSKLNYPRRKAKSGSAVEALGCTGEEFRVYLEAKFYPHPETGEEMTWNNWSQTGWHIDHIVPLSSVDLSDAAQMLKVCHYSNTQPLWMVENLRKGSKLSDVGGDDG